MTDKGRSRLGRGLGSLISVSSEAPGTDPTPSTATEANTVSLELSLQTLFPIPISLRAAIDEAVLLSLQRASNLPA